jgi:acetyl esterase
MLGQRQPVWRDGRRLHPALQLMLAVGERTGATRTRQDVARNREEMRRLVKLSSPRRMGIHATDRRIPGPAGDIPIRVYRPHRAVAEVAGIVFLHGGGFTTGDLDTHDPTCRLLADASGCAVVAVDYRLAPEHPFPAAVDDATAAYAWVAANAHELGITGAPGVMGDSAGATLSAALCLEVKRLGLPRPAAQCLVYPLVDTRFVTPSYQTFAEGFGLNLEGMHWFRSMYTPDEGDWTDPRASPLCADDLSGLPPALVITAGFDPLRDDGRAYADALAAAGVPTTYRCYDDMMHAFHGMLVLPDAAAAAEAIDVEFGEMVRAVAAPPAR